MRYLLAFALLAGSVGCSRKDCPPCPKCPKLTLSAECGSPYNCHGLRYGMEQPWMPPCPPCHPAQAITRESVAVSSAPLTDGAISVAEVRRIGEERERDQCPKECRRIGDKDRGGCVCP